MDKNFTPLDIGKFKQEGDSKVNFILFLVLVMTAIVLAILLYILIQKKEVQTPEKKPVMNVTPTISLTATPEATVIVSPTVPVASSSPEIDNQANESTDQADIKPSVAVFPSVTTKEASTTAQ